MRHDFNLQGAHGGVSRNTRRSLRLLGGTVLAFLLVLLLPFAASAATTDLKAFVAPTLLEAARADGSRTFDVIVQGAPGRSSEGVALDVLLERGLLTKSPRRFRSLVGVQTDLTGAELLRLARKSGILAITPNAPMRLSSGLALNNPQKWPYVTGVAKYWSPATTGLLQTPTIAIVDSGIDTGRADFGGRVLEQVTMTSLPNNSPGDGRGHGTFVASIAAGGAGGYIGAAPSSPLVSIDVADDTGMAMTADVIRAADWILANKTRLGIRVANFSLHASNPGSFMFDPLNKAVERLWFNGVVVVAAAGNYGALGRGVPFAPGNDPFVITVGASDIDGSVGPRDDYEAPWSAYGYTLDGFAKPELGAPGRYMVGAVPSGATLPTQRPQNVVAPGYMQLSGTSFSAPIVAGGAAVLLALHPNWTPDQVKGALMMTVKATPAATPNSIGVGEVDVARAAALVNPPNPNAGLTPFIVTDLLTGGKSFDAASWTSAALLGASWTSASWTSASWTSASWTSASWTSASWTSASWTSASWTSASWTSASWTSASWTSASWTSTSESDASWMANAETDAGNVDQVTTDEILATELELDLDLNGDGVVGVLLLPTLP
jgi:serine protease AprX